jgi:acetylornithine/N-succinyldiaminopimelate aminotransferase
MPSAAIMNTYGERKLTIVRGEGVYLWDKQGNRYLDALSGIAVCGLGHAHPAVTVAISEQAATLIHTSNLYLTDTQQQLADEICDLAQMDNVFFSNSGAEANEAAIKIARKYGNKKGIQKPTIITANGSFHGRTMATLSATANPKIKEGFSPLVEGFVHVDFNNINAMKDAITDDTVAIMIEPIQGEGGVNIPSRDYLNNLRDLCDDRDLLLIVDEIQTGNCRTGKPFAYQHNNILPDIVTTAKGLGNGFPIGACLARGKAATIFHPGNHGSTYGGNPLGCSVALAVMHTMKKNELANNSQLTGDYISKKLNLSLAASTLVKEIRNKGLMIGIELKQNCAQLVTAASDKGLLINVTANNVIRLLPPLIITTKDADEIIRIITEIIQNLEKNG